MGAKPDPEKARSGERPLTRPRGAACPALHAAILEVLREAVKSARIAYNHPGKFQEDGESVPAVYGREGERGTVCGRRARRDGKGGRPTCFCPHCQNIGANV
jgi:formamidopyrimidine-DNA glycosylase